MGSNFDLNRYLTNCKHDEKVEVGEKCLTWSNYTVIWRNYFWPSSSHISSSLGLHFWGIIDYWLEFCPRINTWMMAKAVTGIMGKYTIAILNMPLLSITHLFNLVKEIKCAYHGSSNYSLAPVSLDRVFSASHAEQAFLLKDTKNLLLQVFILKLSLVKGQFQYKIWSLLYLQLFVWKYHFYFLLIFQRWHFLSSLFLRFFSPIFFTFVKLIKTWSSQCSVCHCWIILEGKTFV